MDQALASNMSIDGQIELFEIMNQNDVNSKNKNCTKTSKNKWAMRPHSVPIETKQTKGRLNPKKPKTF